MRVAGIFIAMLWLLPRYSHGYVESPSRAYYTVLRVRLADTRTGIECRLRPLPLP